MTRKKNETFADFSALRFKLWKKAEVINYFNQLLQNYLDSNWQQHCRVANYRERILIIAVANGSLATHLRFQAQTILSYFNHHQADIKKIEFIIDDSFWKKETHPIEKLKISTQSKTVFESIAKCLKNDRLKKAIKGFVGE